MTRVCLNFDARSVSVESRNHFDVDITVEGAVLDEVISSIGENTVLESIDINNVIEFLEEQGYTIEETNE